MLRAEEAIDFDLVESLLSWRHSGSHAHVGREIAGGDRRALDAVAEYIARGPVSIERLSVDEQGPTPRVRYRSSKVHPRHGTDFRSFDPLDFLAALIPHIPDTHEKTGLYYGWYSNRSRGKRKKEGAAGAAAVAAPVTTPLDDEPRSPASLRWGRPIKKVHEIDPLTCPRCRATMKLISFITEEDVVYRILEQLDLRDYSPLRSKGAPPGGPAAAT